MQRTISIFLLTACIASLVCTGMSCSCLPVSFDQRVCLTKTTVEGTVLARTDNCPGTCDPVDDQGEGMFTYIVRVDKVIRGNRPEDGLMYLKTKVNSALCGVSLAVGQKYLLSLDDMQTDMESCPRNFWEISLCSFPKAVQSLTADEIDVLQKITSGVVSCKDGKIDVFGNNMVTSDVEEPDVTVEPSAEPSELITTPFLERQDAGPQMTAEPMEFPVQETPVESMEML